MPRLSHTVGQSALALNYEKKVTLLGGVLHGTPETMAAIKILTISYY